MSEPERLAKALEAGERSGMWYPSMEAAAELRRLSAELAALKAAMGEPVRVVTDIRTGEKVPLYAIAAIEAQGVPDHCDPSCTSYDLAAMVMSDCGHSTNNQRLLDRIAARIDKHVESLLASAPPAPQAKQCEWTNCPTRVGDKCCNEQASVVQQEPAAWRYQDARGNYRYCGYKAGFDKEYPLLKPVALYTHPAQQAKPQPLSEDEVKEVWRSVKDTGRDMHDAIAFARAIEAAHGIQGSAA